MSSRMKTASFLLLAASFPNAFRSAEAFCSPTVVSSNRLCHRQNQASMKSNKYQQQRTPVRSSLPLHQLNEDYEEMYLDLDDTKLLLRARLYREKISNLQTNSAALKMMMDHQSCSESTVIEELEEEIKAIRNIFMERHMGLVGFVAKNYIKKVQNLTYDDLIQEGVMGLAKAFDKYNPDKNTKFSTYATYWIRASILRGISERDDLVRIPEHITRAISKIGSISSMTNDEDKIHELASKAGLTENQVKLAIQVRDRRRAGGYVAFQSWMKSSANRSSSRTPSTGDINNVSMDTKLDQEIYRDQVKDALSKFLRPKEMEALSWRYGLLEEEEEEEETYSSALTTAPLQSSSFRDYEAEAEMALFGSQGIVKPVGMVLNLQKKAPPQKGRWGEAMTFAEVGKQMAVSAEYGRRLCTQAIKKLQRAAEDGRLDPGLLMS